MSTDEAPVAHPNAGPQDPVRTRSKENQRSLQRMHSDQPALDPTRPAQQMPDQMLGGLSIIHSPTGALSRSVVTPLHCLLDRSRLPPRLVDLLMHHLPRVHIASGSHIPQRGQTRQGGATRED